jgi:C1A family cysteine protease
MIDIRKMGKGAIRQPVKLKDFRFELVAGATLLPKEYSLKNYIGSIKNQNGSSSCVGQSFSYYAEVLNYIETKEKTPLSARDIYSLIHLEEGGAWLKDAASKIRNSGVILEKDAPSYMNGNPPTEDFMRNREDINEQEEEMGMTYLAKTYTTWSNSNFENFKRAIFQGDGCVIACYGNNYCWQNGLILVPDTVKQCDWAHAIFCCGWRIKDGIECLEFVNSWGKEWGFGGFGYLPKSYVEKGLVFNPITLVDVPNNTYSTMKKTISILKNLIELYKELIKKMSGNK